MTLRYVIVQPKLRAYDSEVCYSAAKTSGLCKTLKYVIVQPKLRAYDSEVCYSAAKTSDRPCKIHVGQ